MACQEVSSAVSPATTYCSELEYLIGLQSEECSQRRRSQRLRDKQQTTQALDEQVSKMKITPATKGCSPQLFVDLDGECSQLAQLPPNRTITPKVCNKRKSATGKKRGRKPKIVQSEPIPNKMAQTTSGPEPSALPKALDLPPNNIMPETSITASAIITNSTQTYSYQCTNLTQAVLPERYPAHFIHQLPPEPEYITGTIIPSELRRVSYGAALQEPMTAKSIITTQDVCHEEYSPLSLEAASGTSTSPSLTESLAEVFGTTKIRTLLNIELPREYRVQEFHLPVLASLLDVELDRLRVLLELTQRMTLEQLQQLTQECCDVLSVHSSSEN